MAPLRLFRLCGRLNNSFRNCEALWPQNTTLVCYQMLTLSDDILCPSALIAVLCISSCFCVMDLFSNVVGCNYWNSYKFEVTVFSRLIPISRDEVRADAPIDFPSQVAMHGTCPSHPWNQAWRSAAPLKLPARNACVPYNCRYLHVAYCTP